MDSVASVVYRDYVKVADDLEKRLVALVGRERAAGLYQKMDRFCFEAICRAASADSLKRHWLNKLRRRAQMLNGGKSEKAA